MSEPTFEIVRVDEDKAVLHIEGARRPVVANTAKYEVIKGSKKLATNWALWSRENGNVGTMDVLKAAKGTKAVVAFATNVRASNLSVNFALNDDGLGLGFTVLDAKGGPIHFSIRRALSALMGKFQPISHNAPELTETLPRMDSLPEASMLRAGEEFYYVAGIGTPMNNEARTTMVFERVPQDEKHPQSNLVQRLTADRTGLYQMEEIKWSVISNQIAPRAKVDGEWAEDREDYLARVVECAAEQGWTQREIRIGKADVQAYSPHYLAVRAGLIIGIRTVKTGRVRFVGILSLATLAHLVAGVSQVELTRYSPRGENAEFRPRRSYAQVAAPVAAAATSDDVEDLPF